MKEQALRAIEVVGLGPIPADIYGATDLLVFVDGKFVVPGVHYTFDGSKLEFGTRPNTDVIIFSRATGSFRIIRAATAVDVPKKEIEAIKEIFEKVVEVFNAAELSEEEINDITISQLGETTEPKEANDGP